MRYITVDTKLIALLGTPLRQSVSYLLQNQVFEELGVDFCYFPVEISNEKELSTVVKGLRHMNFAGFAVTKPYKETIIPCLDEVDRTVMKMGACNTVSFLDGKLIGHNTDGIGCIRSLERDYALTLPGKRYVSLGAGGAARAICFELAEHGAAHIAITALAGMAEKLAEEINGHFPGLCTAFPITQQDKVHHAVLQADVLMNLTGLGMIPYEEETPIQADWFQTGQFCYDAIYMPEKTRFLQDAERAGCQIANGLGMVIYQGLEQIRLWTGMDASAETMFRALEKHILVKR